MNTIFLFSWSLYRLQLLFSFIIFFAFFKMIKHILLYLFCFFHLAYQTIYYRILNEQNLIED